jgi:hypothetical protein
MALSKEQLQVQIDQLNMQIGAPERQVTNGNESVTYRSTADLVTARNNLQSELDKLNFIAAGKTRRRVQYLTYGGRGF